MARFTLEEGLKAIVYQFALLYIFNQDWKATENPRKPYPRSVRHYNFVFSKYLLGINPKYPSSTTGHVRDKAIEQEVKKFWEAVLKHAEQE